MLSAQEQYLSNDNVSEMLAEMFSGFKNDEIKEFNLPEFKTTIAGPAMIVIPVAIYA